MDLNPDIDEYYSPSRFEVLAVQMREAKRLMLSDSSAQLRVAYILLDNAAEVIMHRSIYPELIHNDFYASLLRQWDEIVEHNPTPESIAHREEIAREVISEKKIKEIDKDFAAKANFLVTRDKMESSHALALKRLHEYRNEMYHRDHVRHDVIQTVTYMYFELVCSLLERYDKVTAHPYVGPRLVFNPERRGVDTEAPAEAIATELRKGFDVAWSQATSQLRDNLVERIANVMAETVLVTLVFADTDEDLAIKLAQTFQASPTDSPELLRQLDFSYKYSWADLCRWQARADKLNPTADRIKFFNAFATLEREFEPCETDVSALYKELQRMRQRQLDLAEEGEKIERFNRRMMDEEP